MKLLQQILNAKPHRLITVDAGATVLEALRILAQYDIGALLVTDQGQPAGIFSERDLARKMVLLGREASNTPVRDVMSAKIIYVTLNQTVEDCMAIMTERHIRHLPVLGEDGSVAGFLSIGDLVKEVISEKSVIIEQLIHYITH